MAFGSSCLDRLPQPSAAGHSAESWSCQTSQKRLPTYFRSSQGRLPLSSIICCIFQEKLDPHGPNSSTLISHGQGFGTKELRTMERLLLLPWGPENRLQSQEDDKLSAKGAVNAFKV